MDKKYDLTGQTYNSWLVLSRAPSNKNQDAYWFCKCLACGKEKRVKGSFIRRGKSTNCGCKRARTFGKRKQLPAGEGAIRQVFRSYKHTAKWKNRPFELSLEEFKSLTKLPCHYCGVPPCQTVQRKHNGGKTFGTTCEYNGIDRLDSSKGYTKENCVSCCGIHNKMKLAMSPEEFLAACLSVVEHYGKRARLEQALPAMEKESF